MKNQLIFYYHIEKKIVMRHGFFGNEKLILNFLVMRNVFLVMKTVGNEKSAIFYYHIENN